MPLSKLQLETKLHGRRRGRPTKYRAIYAKQVVPFCANGWSLTAFAAEIGASRENISDWCELSVEFSKACDRAKAAAARWWERQAHKQAQRGASGGQVAMTLFMLKNFGRLDFVDKVEHTGPDGSPLSLQVLLSEIAKMPTIDLLPTEAREEKPALRDDTHVSQT